MFGRKKMDVGLRPGRNLSDSTAYRSNGADGSKFSWRAGEWRKPSGKADKEEMPRLITYISEFVDRILFCVPVVRRHGSNFPVTEVDGLTLATYSREKRISVLRQNLFFVEKNSAHSRQTCGNRTWQDGLQIPAGCW